MMNHILALLAVALFGGLVFLQQFGAMYVVPPSEDETLLTLFLSVGPIAFLILLWWFDQPTWILATLALLFLMMGLWGKVERNRGRNRRRGARVRNG
jgi:O-antigen ligase